MPNKQQATGRAKEMTGKTQKAAGRVTGNEKMEEKGRAKQARGTIEKTVGDAKDKVKSVADKVRGK